MILFGDPDELERGDVTGPNEVVHLVEAFGEDARRVEPPHDVHAAVETREPYVASHRERDGATRGLDFVGQLHAGGGRPDHEDSPIGELVRVAVFGRRQAGDVRRHGPGDRRHIRPVVRTAGQDHGPCTPLLVARP